MFIEETIPVAVLQDIEHEDHSKDDEETCTYERQNDAFKPTKSGNNQLIAQTITNAFAQANKNELLSGIPIPAFGITPDKLYIFAYDCKNDVLLKKVDGLRIFDSTTIVMLWLYLNFSIFMKKKITDLKEHPKLCEYKAKFLSEYVKRLYSEVRSCVVSFTNPHDEEPDVLREIEA